MPLNPGDATPMPHAMHVAPPSLPCCWASAEGSASLPSAVQAVSCSSVLPLHMHRGKGSKYTNHVHAAMLGVPVPMHVRLNQKRKQDEHGLTLNQHLDRAGELKLMGVRMPLS